jgi:ribosomal protein S3
LEKAQVSRIVIERTLKLVTITICTARPGIVIGKGGQDVDKLKEELKKLYKKDIQINIFEVKRPELDATIVVRTSPARLSTSWLTAAPSRWLFRTQCALVPRVSRYRSRPSERRRDRT